mgnify:FL=1
MSVKVELLKSLKLKYEQEIQQNKATMLIYLNNPVGIGEHPQHLEEMDTLIDKMATAKDKLEILNEYFA